MTPTSMFGSLTPPVVAPPIEVRVGVDRTSGDSTLTTPWETLTAAEYEALRGQLLTQVGDPDGVVSVWLTDDTEVLVPSRLIRALQITTRPVTAGGSS